MGLSDRDHRDTAARERVTEVSFSPLAERRSVLDRAHRGDVEGALGRLGVADTSPRRSLRHRLRTFLALVGPGVVVMVASNDAGGVATYAEAGQDHGLAMVWLLVVLAPILFVNQEMVARLGAVTGAGHARLIVERFGRRWGAFALGDLLILNFLTLITQFIGIALALGYFGVSRYVSVPIAAVGLVAVTVGGGFRRWERSMLALAVASLAAVPLAVVCFGARSSSGSPTFPVGDLPFDRTTVLFVIGFIGTTVAPWQLFFHQSYVVDKRITPRWMTYTRIDTLVGTMLFAIGAVAVLAACAWAFGASVYSGGFVDAGTTAAGLRDQVGTVAGALFAVVLLNGSMLGAGAVTLSASYAIGDVFGTRHSLHRGWRDATVFHGSFIALVLVAAGVVLIPGTPLGIVTAGVQVLAGVLLPSATVFLVLICNDRAVVGPWANPRWLNALATVIVAVLIAMSMLLTWTTLFGPAAPPPTVAAVIVAIAVTVIVLAIVGLAIVPTSPGAASSASADGEDPRTWTMPAIDRLPPPPTSRTRTAALVVLRIYLLLAAGLVVVKVAQAIAAS